MPRRPRAELRAVPLVERATHAVALHLAESADLEVTQGEAHVLAFLLAHGASRIADIHAEFGHRRSTLTGILDRLEKRRLLLRTIDDDDRRAILVSPTAAGLALARRVFDVLHRFETLALAAFTPSQIETFRAVAAALGATESSAAPG